MEEASWDGTSGEVKDESVNGNDGQSFGGADTNASGKLGRCGDFDGVNDRVLVPDDASLRPGTGDTTVAAWIKTTDNGSSRRITNKVSLDNGYGLQIHLTFARFFIRDGFANTFIVGGTAINDDGWHHVVGIRRGQQIEIYVDGDADASPVTLVGAKDVNNTIALTIGATILAGDAYAGLIDEVTIYSRALNECEISELYNNGSGRIIANPSSSSSSSSGA